ncbi:MAG: MFS transporter [Acidimicrobiia bacterium]
MSDDTAATGGQPSLLRNRSFLRLWSAQCVSSLGDWMGLFAVLAIAGRLQPGNAAFAISLVTLARVAPGLVLAPIAGVLVDRWDRRRTMIVTDIGRGCILALIPFVSSIWQLILASLVLEVFTLLWQPAKEALVPNLVSSEQLVSANSLGLLAAYATFPVGALVFAALAGVAPDLGSQQESLALWADTVTFLTSAALVWSIRVAPSTSQVRIVHDEDGGTGELARRKMHDTWTEVREGWQFIFAEPVVRMIMLGFSVALLGGAAVIPLGPLYAEQVLGGNASTYGLIQFAMGFGAALGVGGVILWTRRGSHSAAHVFTLGLLVCGAGLIGAATVHSLALGFPLILVFGMGAGATYVTGFAALQENVDDELRGRVFASLLLIIRLCMLLALAIAPALAGVADGVLGWFLPDGEVGLSGFRYGVSGTEIVLMLGGATILLTGLWARRQYHQLHDVVDRPRTGGSEGAEQR